ncbi:hypothetical protein LNP07_04625 [Apilactobacillus sp. M161]|uniref:Uncharacterized protein n=1 Tax=Apilactobacillus xinyiensis TaxID=2841032 RepID=A0ABT0I253_9LACO|nr:hypothetical protein [Apilactobacillus xinyiensis]MCK8624796.1 hypothetical protein [Apilactobacillus xinyiensis]
MKKIKQSLVVIFMAITMIFIGGSVVSANSSWHHGVPNVLRNKTYYSSKNPQKCNKTFHFIEFTDNKCTIDSMFHNGGNHPLFYKVQYQKIGNKYLLRTKTSVDKVADIKISLKGNSIIKTQKMNKKAYFRIGDKKGLMYQNGIKVRKLQKSFGW